MERIIADLNDDDELFQAAALTDGAFNLTDAEALADSAPVRKLLNMVLLLAIKDHASDIHFEPFEDEFRIRIKAEGVLYEMVPPRGTWHLPSPRASKSWPTWISPNAVCRRTDASS
jgi:type IV pilus assembly protein PilB